MPPNDMHAIAVDAHPLLDLRAFTTEFPSGLGPTPPECLALLSLDAAAPVKSDDKVRDAVRRLLRHGGFKPSGRSKPASEYLVRAVGDGTLGTINAAVDVCNIVSLHSGLPISVVDLAKAKEHFRVGIAPAGASYVFNAAGQTIDLEGLLCLFDADGPCGNAVKDAQRTKTDAETTRTLTVIWGTVELPGQAAKAENWYRDLLHGLGAKTESAMITTPAA
jgi:DNA/RNA-binding domain of Phe-tRNA-synthetase-like protein